MWQCPKDANAVGTWGRRSAILIWVLLAGLGGGLPLVRSPGPKAKASENALGIATSTISANSVLAGQDLLLVVNQDSPTSVYIAGMYRQYHPEIANNQVVYLTGIPDSSGPGSTAEQELISRSDYETRIAAPLRAYLIANGLVNRIKVIVTTAGLPYRIKDTTYPGLVTAAGSSVSYDPCQADAASVESELTCLFLQDPNAPPLTGGPGMTTPIDLRKNRIVNPYQAYRGTPITSFPRDIINNRYGNIKYAGNIKKSAFDTQVVLMEGSDPDNGYNFGRTDRHFSAGDMYLTCRLDGPKATGKSAIFVVRDMLERARRASSGTFGIKPSQAVAVFDDVPYTGTSYGLDCNRVCNMLRAANYNVYDSASPQPPDITDISAGTRDDYRNGFKQMTGFTAANSVMNLQPMPTARAPGYNLYVIGDLRAHYRISQSDLAAGQAICAFACCGINGDEKSASDYLLHGLNGGPLFKVTYGAVFTSLESFNALTLFSDRQTTPVAQGKIVDFLAIGGSGAIGHTFEPMADATIDNEFFVYNLFADSDMDGYADLTFVEAAWSAIPYVSWSEVVIGDPLMRIAYGAGGIARATRLEGDVNGDGYVTRYDVSLIYSGLGLCFGQPGYDDRMDVNRDGYITRYDVSLTYANLGAME